MLSLKQEKRIAGLLETFLTADCMVGWVCVIGREELVSNRELTTSSIVPNLNVHSLYNPFKKTVSRYNQFISVIACQFIPSVGGICPWIKYFSVIYYTQIAMVAKNA